jgi:hypothetical protein
MFRIRNFRNLRNFSTSLINNTKKIRRGHGGIKPNKPISRINKLNFKPINNKTIDNNKNEGKNEKKIIDNSNIKDKLDNEYKILMNWYNYIENEDNNNIQNNEIIIKNILENIIAYSEFNKNEQLEDNMWKLLRKQVIIYDNMVGPLEGEGEEGINNNNNNNRLEIPEDIKEGIIYCRENKDYDNMLRLYDFYFQLLTKSPLMHEIEHREELIRNNQINIEEEGEDKFNKMNDLVDKFYNIFKEEIKRDKSVEIVLKNFAIEIEKEWYKIEIPRNLKIYYSSYNKLIKILNNEENLKLFDIKFINDFFKDLINSEMNFEYDELKIMFSNIIRFQKFNDKIYENFKIDIIEKMNMVITPEIYKIFLRACLIGNEFKLFKKILKDFNKEKYMIDREIIEILIKYYSIIGDINKLIKTIKFEIIEMKIPLFNKDFKNLIDSLIRIGYRNASVDIMKSLIIVSNNNSTFNNNEMREDLIKLNMLEDYEIDFNLMLSYIKDIIVIKPIINDEIFNNILITSESLQEYEKLQDIIRSNIGHELTAEQIKIEILINETFGVFDDNDNKKGFNKFQNIIKNAFEKLSFEQIDQLVSDKDFVASVIRIIDKCVAQQIINLEEDSEMAHAYGCLLVASETETDIDNNNKGLLLNVAQARELLRQVHAPLAGHVLTLAGITATE